MPDNSLIVTPQPKRIHLATGLMAAGVSPVTGALTGSTHGSAQWAWGIGTAVTAVYAAWTTYKFQNDLEAAKKVAIADRVRLADALKKVAPPLWESLTSVYMAAKGNPRHVALGQLQARAVDGARVCGDERTRIALYLITPHEGHSATTCVRLKLKVGRESDQPREWFCGSEGDEDKEVLRYVEGPGGQLYRDLCVDRFRGIHEPEKRSYQCLMLTPVRAAGKPFGMLSVDHPVAGTFDEEDLALLNMLALALGAGMTVGGTR